MILVVRYEVNFDNIESYLKDQIKVLELELNENKTEHYNDISEFLETVKPDNYLSELGKEFNLLLYPLWMMNYNYRTQFEFANSRDNHSSWWHLIKLYRQCLYSVKIYVTETDLSRKIHKYLAKKNMNTNEELNLPNFIMDDNFVVIYNWANNFEGLNSEWIDKKIA